ncbi:MAG: hypothetical protein M3Y41_04080 [Pseudomonadota bacterium]|nr:hypothetical protein [Pseudomonadota bacterium]
MAAGTAALLAGGAIVPALAAQPDAELVALCARFDALERQINALFGRPAAIEDEDVHDAIEPIWKAQLKLTEMICSLRATSLAGHRARASSIG